MCDVFKLIKYRIQCCVGFTVVYLKFNTKMIYAKNHTLIIFENKHILVKFVQVSLKVLD